MKTKASGDATAPAPVGDDAVRARTGKGWDDWFAILDAAGAAGWDHKEIAAYLGERQGVGPWWCQMVTVGYERARGRRQVHETTSGFTVNKSKTFAVPVATLYRAWHDEAARRRWLGESVVVRKATPNRSLRITWSDGVTNVDVGFTAKGDAKSQVAVEHSKLADAGEVERMKAFWSEALDRLKAALGA